MTPRLPAFTLAALALTLTSGTALAHIELDAPAPRYNDGDNKWCPCGGGGDGTRANAGCAIEASDLDRGSTSTTFAPGATVTVRWRETVGHTGRMRIAFDPDGADQADFDDNILIDLADPAGNTGNAGSGNNWEAEVTLPTTPCTNCTLQLVQVMNGNDDDPVVSVFGTSTYFQCANLVIGEGGEGEGDPGEGEGEPGEGEGDPAEGEGDPAGGEGEGEGDGCAATPALAFVGLPALVLVRRRTRPTGA
ncbi:MAG: lytic polysaccharide monooxygenase [Deltaproteobacteria bacterium]|nr:lytic polysaccharide monooxygenase [Deltaproteobacteria bacterium]